jgi:2-polyprenyl-6-methoxyphenol hydroxylase-like FAD-dependent oxidoreductase
MYPVGSNGASQAILDARCLADHLAGAELPAHGLFAYEAERLPVTAEIVRSNRRGGPEGVIDAVEELAPGGFDDIEQVLPHAMREAIVRGYAAKAGFCQGASEGGLTPRLVMVGLDPTISFTKGRVSGTRVAPARARG